MNKSTANDYWVVWSGIKKYISLLYILSILLMLVDVKEAISSGIDANDSGTIQSIVATQSSDICTNQFEAWQNDKGMFDIPYKGMGIHFGMELLVTLLLPIIALFFSNLSLKEFGQSISKNFSSKGFVRKIILASLVIGLIFSFIDVLRWIASSVLITEWFGYKKHLYTWTSWCIAPAAVSVTDVLSKMLASMAFFVPLGILWVVTGNEFKPMMNLNDKDLKCGLKGFLNGMLIIKMFLSLSLAILVLFWIKYVNISSDDKIFYMITPIILAILLTVMYVRILRKYQDINKEYQQAYLRKLQMLQEEHNIAIDKVDARIASKLVVNPVEEALGPYSVKLSVEVSRPSIVSAIGVVVDIAGR